MEKFNIGIKTFKQQLFLLLSISILFISLVLAGVASWISIQENRKLLIESGEHLAYSAAKYSRLALIYQSGENAGEAARNVLAFPDVVHMAIINPDLSVLYQGGTQISEHKLVKEDVKNLLGVKELYTDQYEWHFVAPVWLESDQIDHDEYSSMVHNRRELAQQKTVIGYVYLALSKRHLNETQFTTLKTNLILGVILGVIVLAVVYLVLRYFLAPLNMLTKVMTDSLGSEPMNYSGPEGPQETQQIARAYNQLVNAVVSRDREIQQYSQSLEKKVKERTREIIEARDEAIRANKYKTEFLSNTTHELRTPLQAIIGYTEVASELALEEGLLEIENDLNNIDANSRHLLMLINSILDISKIESGTAKADYSFIDIDGLVQQVKSATLPLALKNNNELSIHIENPDIPVFSDRSKLMQILINLIGNSAKFTENGKIDVHIGVKDEMLIMSVADTGIGIEDDKKDLIFKAFHQADGSIIRHYGGTGLGLTLTKQFCELLNGDINLESVPKKGSRFTVTIPCNDKTQACQN